MEGGGLSSGRGFEYLCKFAHQSYLHAQWVPSEEMVDLDVRKVWYGRWE